MTIVVLSGNATLSQDSSAIKDLLSSHGRDDRSCFGGRSLAVRFRNQFYVSVPDCVYLHRPYDSLVAFHNLMVPSSLPVA